MEVWLRYEVSFMVFFYLRVVQVGTHDTLIEEEGFYKNLVAAQFDKIGVLKRVHSKESKLAQEVIFASSGDSNQGCVVRT